MVESTQKFNHCILCNASSFHIVHRKDQWQYLSCRNCNLVSVHPRPTSQEVTRHYEDYLPTQSKEIEQWKSMMRVVIDKSANLVESRVKNRKGRLLDIGCGYGFFLQEMKVRGWKVEGLEIAEVGREYTKDKWAIPVHSQPLEDLALSPNLFDAITLFYVIEHIIDPLTLLKEVKRILKPAGLVLLRWPHSTPLVKMLGPLSQKLDLYHTPYHLYDFSPKTIKILLNLGGFEKIETTIGGYTLPVQRSSRWPSIIFGQLGEILYRFSGGSILFPGISKTTLAIKPG